MNNDGITGINIGQVKLDNYEGNTKDANLNAKGSFSGRKVRRFNNQIGSYLTGSHDLQIQQDKAQKKLNGMRITVLNKNGNASNTAQEVNRSEVKTNANGQLDVAKCPDLEKSLQKFKTLASDPMASGEVGKDGWYEKKSGEATKVIAQGGGSTRKIVDPEKFKQRVQKDLTVFLGNTIKKTNTPHGLERLRQTVQQQFDDGQISMPQKNHLNKLVGKQFELQLNNFPDYLAGLKAKENDGTARYMLAREKLAAIHEITIAAKQFDPGIVKKHRQMLKTEALACYSDCGKNTPSKCDDLSQAKQWIESLNGEAKDLLKPVINLTSKHSAKRMTEAEQSVENKVYSLKQQLDEIPALETSMSKMTKESVKLMQGIAKIESAIQQNEKQLGNETQDLEKMRNDAGRLRRMNPAYQLRRTNNRQQQKKLTELISTNNKNLSALNNQFNSNREAYNKQFESKEVLLKKYGESIEVLPKAPEPSAAALVWKAEISKLDGDKRVTEFDKACINHYLDDIASKSPGHDFQDSLVTHINDVAKEYVSAVKDQDSIPFIALKSTLANKRISSVLDIQKAPDTSGYDDISQQNDEEPVIQSTETLETDNSPDNSSISSELETQQAPDDSGYESVDDDISQQDNGELVNQSTETSQDTLQATKEQTFVPTLNGSDFSLLLRQKLEGNQNPGATPENLERLAPIFEQMLGEESLQKGGLEELAEFYETCASANWDLNDLMPALAAGVEALINGKGPKEAADEMEAVLNLINNSPDSSSISSQQVPDTSDYESGYESVDDDISQQGNEELVNQSTETSQDTLQATKEQTFVPTLNGSDFSLLLRQKLEGNQNQDVTDNLEQLAPIFERMLGEESLQKDGLEELADYYEACASLNWDPDDLTPALRAGVEALIDGKGPEEAADEMEAVLIRIKSSEADNPSDNSSSTQV